jgi:GDP-L-fucose synthase
MLLVQGQSYRQEYGFNAIYLILENLYGPGDNFDPKSSHVIPALIHKVAQAQASKTDHVDVWGTGVATREFLYVDDAAEGIIRATENYDKPDPVNLGSGNEIPIKELVTLIAKEMGFSGEIRWDSTKPDGQLRRGFDISRARKEFGFNPAMSFEEGLRHTIEWYRVNIEKPVS